MVADKQCETGVVGSVHVYYLVFSHKYLLTSLSTLTWRYVTASPLLKHGGREHVKVLADIAVLWLK